MKLWRGWVCALTFLLWLATGVNAQQAMLTADTQLNSAAQEIDGGKFTIRTDNPNVKVSWQVTGVRQDAWANAHRIPGEENKTAADKGAFLHPDLFGHKGEMSITDKKLPPQIQAKHAILERAAEAQHVEP